MPTEDLYRSYVPPEPAGSDEAALLFARVHLVPALALAPSGPILEAGAGTGATWRALRTLGVGRVIATDGSPSQVEEALRRGTDVQLADAIAAVRAHAASSLAGIIALDLLEHLDDEYVLELLGLCAERLKVGGVLLLRVPNGAGLFGGVIRYGDFTHRRAFTERSVKQVLRLRGLEPVAVRPCRPVVHGLASFLRASSWRLIEWCLRFASAAEAGAGESIVTRNLFAVARRSS